MVEVTIKRLGQQGDGIGELDGREIFVPFTLPDEVVEGEVLGGQLVQPRILTPSASRVTAPCPRFRTCGGCSLQHASDSFLADWKSGIIKSALAAQGLSTELRATVTSPASSRRRASLGGRRTKKGAMVGFHGRASDTLVAIDGCTLLHPDILAAIPVLERLASLGASRKGEISLAVTQSDMGLDVSVTKAKNADGPLLAELGQLVGTGNITRLSWNGELVATKALPSQTFGPVSVVPPSGSFLQATEHGQKSLIRFVSEAVGPVSKIVDLFAGCGTFALPLAQRAEVIAVESDGEALLALDAAWRKAAGLRGVTTENRDLFRRPLMPDELKSIEAAVIDPPRAGAKAQVAELAASKVPRIAYVSCNPVTFARDAKVLVESGFRLDWIVPVDQFRWSGHVELVAQFTRG